MNNAILTLIRLVFGFTSRIAPKTTGRIAFRLFCRTTKTLKTSAKHKDRIDNALQLFSAATRHTLTYSGGSIAAFEFPPHPSVHETTEPTAEQKTVLLVHGWQSNSYFMALFVEPIRRCGFRVVAMDLPGHGLSSGRTFHIPLAVEAMQVVFKHFQSIDGIISHSLGGPVVAASVVGTLPSYPPLSVPKLVLISSPNSMTSIFDDFTSMVNLGPGAIKEVHAIVKKLSSRTTDDFNVSSQLANSGVKLLLMHAPDDKEVSYVGATEIAASDKSFELVPVPGMGHRRIIHNESVATQATTFACA